MSPCRHPVIFTLLLLFLPILAWFGLTATGFCFKDYNYHSHKDLLDSALVQMLERYERDISRLPVSEQKSYIRYEGVEEFKASNAYCCSWDSKDSEEKRGGFIDRLFVFGRCVFSGSDFRRFTNEKSKT